MTTAEAARLLLGWDRLLLLTHVRPDGDTVGSAAALCRALRDLGKTAYLLPNPELTATYAPYAAPYAAPEGFVPDRVVSVDIAALSLLPENARPYGERIDLAIDHHPSQGFFARETCLEADSAACGEIVYDIITRLTPVTPDIALPLYVAVSTDTGCFKFANTTARTHEIAAKLITAGASLVKLNNILFESKSRSRLAIERLALESLEYSFGGRCATVYLTKEQIAETGADGTDLEGITSLPRMIEGVEVGITIRQQPTGSYKVSVRTVTGVDASAICAHLGGGGHKQAAGCELLGSLDNAKAALLTEVEKALCKES